MTEEQELENEKTVLTMLTDCNSYLQLLAQKRLLGDKYENGNWLEKELNKLEKRFLLIKRALDFIETMENKN